MSSLLRWANVVGGTSRRTEGGFEPFSSEPSHQIQFFYPLSRLFSRNILSRNTSYVKVAER